MLEPHPEFLRWVAGLVPSQIQARVSPDDLLQEAWLQVARHMDLWQRLSQEQQEAWLRRTVRRRMLSLRRKHLAARRSASREQSLRGRVIDERRWIQQERREWREHWETRLQVLQPMNQAVVRCRLFEGRLWSEVAGRMQISVSQAKERYAQAIAKLRSIETYDQTPASRSVV